MNGPNYKNKHELNLPPSFYSLSQKAQSKNNVNNVPSKSYSESFLSQIINKKSTKNSS